MSFGCEASWLLPGPLPVPPGHHIPESHAPSCPARSTGQSGPACCFCADRPSLPPSLEPPGPTCCLDRERSPPPPRPPQRLILTMLLHSQRSWLCCLRSSWLAAGIGSPLLSMSAKRTAMSHPHQKRFIILFSLGILWNCERETIGGITFILSESEENKMDQGPVACQIGLWN